MNLDWILNPLTAYAGVAVALAACLACFIAMKLEVFRLRRTAAESGRALQQKVEEMESALSQISRQAQEPPVESLARPLALRPSLNLTRRTHALRMRRRGESVESIAAALAAPRNEIELLLKVYEIVEYRRQIKAPAAAVAAPPRA